MTSRRSLKTGLSATSRRTQYVGVEQFSRAVVRGHYVALSQLHEHHQRFATAWARNLDLQGFAKPSRTLPFVVRPLLVERIPGSVSPLRFHPPEPLERSIALWKPPLSCYGPMLLGQGLPFFLAPRFFLIFICSSLRASVCDALYLGHILVRSYLMTTSAQVDPRRCGSSDAPSRPKASP